jgi:hypothetical protein
VGITNQNLWVYPDLVADYLDLTHLDLVEKLSGTIKVMEIK